MKYFNLTLNFEFNIFNEDLLETNKRYFESLRT